MSWFCFGFHDWYYMKWSINLDCRKCLRCKIFEIYAYGSFHEALEENFLPASCWYKV